MPNLIKNNFNTNREEDTRLQKLSEELRNYLKKLTDENGTGYGKQKPEK